MNKRRNVLYIGVTSHLWGRVLQHKNREILGFTCRYNVNKLVYFEEYRYVDDAIKREKRIKNWHRQWKINQIQKSNPDWTDLSDGWYETLK